MLSLLKSEHRPSGSGQLNGGPLSLRIAAHVKASLHADGVVLMDLNQGTVFSANRAGAIIWNAAVERWSLDRVVASISTEFHVPAQTAQEDAAEFLAQLAAAGLLVADSN